MSSSETASLELLRYLGVGAKPVIAQPPSWRSEFSKSVRVLRCSRRRRGSRNRRAAHSVGPWANCDEPPPSRACTSRFFGVSALMSATRAQRLFALVSAAYLGVACAGGGWDVAKQLPATYFNEDDWKLLRQAVRTVIEADAQGKLEKWSNPTSGHSGAVSSLKSFTGKDGRPCRFLQIDNKAEGLAGSMRYTVCRDAEGVWRDADSGAPFMQDGARG